MLFLTCQQVKYAKESVAVSKENVVLTDKQLQVAREALDRSAGKIVAKFSIADAYPQERHFREDEKTLLFGNKDKARPYYKDVNSLVLKPPTLYLNNIGTESIDAVRVEVSFIEGVIDRHVERIKPEPPPDWFKIDTPVGIRKVEAQEHLLLHQWKPGRSLKLPLLRGVLAQLYEFQSRSIVDKLHFAQLEIIVSARLTGSSAYDTNEVSIIAPIAWLPQGFSEAEYKRVHDHYVPKIEIGDPVEQRIVVQQTSRERLRRFSDAVNYANPASLEPKKKDKP